MLRYMVPFVFVALLATHASAKPLNELLETLDTDISALVEGSLARPLLDAFAKYAHMEWHAPRDMSSPGSQLEEEDDVDAEWVVEVRGLSETNMFSVHSVVMHSSGKIELVLGTPSEKIVVSASKPTMRLEVTLEFGKGPFTISYDPATGPSPQSLEVIVAGLDLHQLLVLYTPQVGAPTAINCYEARGFGVHAHQGRLLKLSWDSIAVYMLTNPNQGITEMENYAPALATPQGVRHSITVTPQSIRFSGYIIGGKWIEIMGLPTIDKCFSLQSITLKPDSTCADVIGLNLLGEADARERVRRVRLGDLDTQMPPVVGPVDNSVGSLKIIRDIVCSAVGPLTMLFPMLGTLNPEVVDKPPPTIISRRTFKFESTGIAHASVRDGVITSHINFAAVRSIIQIAPYPEEEPTTYKLFEMVSREGGESSESGEGWERQSLTVHVSLNDDPITGVRTATFTLPSTTLDDGAFVAIRSGAQQYVPVNIRYSDFREGAETFKDVVRSKWNRRGALRVQQSHAATPATRPGNTLDVQSMRVSMPIDLQVKFNAEFFPAIGAFTVATPSDSEVYLAISRTRNVPDGAQIGVRLRRGPVVTDLAGRVTLDVSGVVVENPAHSVRISIRPETASPFEDSPPELLAAWEYSPGVAPQARQNIFNFLPFVRSANEAEDTFPNHDEHIVATTRRCSARAAKGPSVHVESIAETFDVLGHLTSLTMEAVLVGGLGFVLNWVIGAEAVGGPLRDAERIGDVVCHVLANMVFNSI